MTLTYNLNALKTLESIAAQSGCSKAVYDKGTLSLYLGETDESPVLTLRHGKYVGEWVLDAVCKQALAALGKGANSVEFSFDDVDLPLPLS